MVAKITKKITMVIACRVSNKNTNRIHVEVCCSFSAPFFLIFFCTILFFFSKNQFRHFLGFEPFLSVVGVKKKNKKFLLQQMLSPIINETLKLARQLRDLARPFARPCTTLHDLARPLHDRCKLYIEYRCSGAQPASTICFFMPFLSSSYFCFEKCCFFVFLRFL